VSPQGKGAAGAAQLLTGGGQRPWQVERAAPAGLREHGGGGECGQPRRGEPRPSGQQQDGAGERG
jgi:hypothetical protein